MVVIGALPRAGALVSLEAVSLAPRAVNPHGLAFVSGQAGSAAQPVEQMLPLADKAMRDLGALHRAVNVEAADVQRVTCFTTSLADVAEVTKRVQNDYPQAALNFIKLQRTPASAVIECESAARLRSAVAEPLKLVYAEALPKSPNFSHVALVGAKQIVFSGMFVAANTQETEARRAFEQLGQTLQTAGASIKNVAMSSVFPVSQAAADLARRIRFDYYDKARPPASTLLLFEGLAEGAAFAVDVVAVKQ
jgi:enamine deaminase RidA (YjgF/YER057c/UK114 family)